MLSVIETIVPIVVGVGGGALLILGIIYEDILIAFENGLREHVKKKVKKWKRRAKSLFGAMFSIIAER